MPTVTTSPPNRKGQQLLVFSNATQTFVHVDLAENRCELVCQKVPTHMCHTHDICARRHAHTHIPLGAAQRPGV